VSDRSEIFLRQQYDLARDMPVSPRRRRLLKAALLAATLPWVMPIARGAGRQVLFSDYPFKLGVASGTPTDRSVVLWTRLCPDPFNGGGMGVENVLMRWEVAHDEHFGQIVQSGEWHAMAGMAHSAHIEVNGLAPDRWYFYRFIAGNEVSPTGRTRTLPSADQAVDKLRFALASCQHYELGYFSAYRHMLADNPDLVLFVGDYIYEYTAEANRVRMHSSSEPYDLAGYRTRYAQYHLDDDLKAMHQAAPWVLTIDDHEVMNDWGGDVGEDLDPDFPLRRANALQAYFEHQPLPMGTLGKDRALSIYRGVQAGQLARFHVLDDRQYRSAEVCSPPGMGGGNFYTHDSECPQRTDMSRTILGATQERWLAQQLRESRARWNFIVQETLFSPLPGPSAKGPEFYTDAWDGYPGARQRLVHDLVASKASNPVILGGDYHCTIACDVKADFARPSSATIASEFVGTSITSPGMPQKQLAERIAANPHARYGDSEHRGYLLFDLVPGALEVAARSMASVREHDSACTTTHTFRIEDGRPGIHDA